MFYKSFNRRNRVQSMFYYIIFQLQLATLQQFLKKTRQNRRYYHFKKNKKGLKFNIYVYFLVQLLNISLYLGQTVNLYISQKLRKRWTWKLLIRLKTLSYQSTNGSLLSVEKNQTKGTSIDRVTCGKGLPVP